MIWEGTFYLDFKFRIFFIFFSFYVGFFKIQNWTVLNYKYYGKAIVIRMNFLINFVAETSNEFASELSDQVIAEF